MIIPTGGIDADDYKYRSLTASKKDLSPLTQQRMFEIAYYLYETNPLAHRILEMTKDFVVGGGLTYTVKDEQVKEILDGFWNDPVNHWDLKQHQKALELGLYGEQCYPVFVNNVDGSVRLGYADPNNISEVITDPENAEQAIAVVLKSEMGQDKKTLAIVRHDSSGKLTVPDETTAGGCFFFAINKVSNATRGRSDLLPVADWIDAYDKMLFNRLDRQALMNCFLWDITLEDMTPDKIEEFLRTVKPPNPGEIRAHNQKVKWEAVTPDLKASDAEIEAKLIKAQILSGAGLPPHWFAEGGDVNRATALEMGTPIFRRLVSRQKYFCYMVEHIFNFVIDQAIIHNSLPENIDRTFEIIAPEISTKDMVGMATALQQISNSLAIATSQGWISKETARAVFGTLCTQVTGYEIEMSEEADRLGAEKESDSQQDYESRPFPAEE